MNGTGARLTATAIAGIAALIALVAIVPAASQESPAKPRRSSLEERVDVRMVQVVLTVVDRKVSEHASVPDIPDEDFIVKIDGRELAPEMRARTVIDRMCERTETSAAVEQALGRKIPDRPMILVVDFNYLDALSRHNVARALRRAAETVGESGVEYKVYGYTRDLEILTPTKGFVTDPAELRAAADRIERTIYTRRGASGIALADDASTSADSLGGGDALLDAPSTGPSRDSFGDTPVTSLFDDLAPEEDFNPLASLGALERVMIIHASIPRQKTVVLFSSESFGFADPAKEERAIHDLLAGRTGYRFWPVVADGLASEIDATTSAASRILASLAGNTGGQTTRRTGNLHTALENAAEQLSCYYLISVPVAVTDEDAEYKLTVQLDREGKDEQTAEKYFRYRLDWDRKTVTFKDPDERRRELRMAALFSPDDFGVPPLTVTLDYPRPAVGRGGAEPGSPGSREERRARRRTPDAEMIARFRVRLADLDWNSPYDTISTRAARFEARFVPALVVEQHDAHGVRVLCEFDAELEEPFRTREITVPLRGGRPNERDPLAVSLEFACPLDSVPEGLYVARGLITDVGSGRIAADRASVWLHRDDLDEEDDVKLLAPRLETVTSREIVWDAASRERRWDRRRERAWRALDDEDTIRPDDRLALRYTLCAPPGELPERSVGHALIRRSGSGPSLEYFLGEEMFRVGEGLVAGRRTFCPQAEVLFEPFTFTDPGEYAVVAFRSDLSADGVLAAVDAGSTAALSRETGILAVVPFDVAE